MTTQKELEELRKKKSLRDIQRKIDSEASEIQEELESNTIKGTLKKAGKGLFKKLMK